MDEQESKEIQRIHSLYVAATDELKRVTLYGCKNCKKLFETVMKASREICVK